MHIVCYDPSISTIHVCLVLLLVQHMQHKKNITHKLWICIWVWHIHIYLCKCISVDSEYDSACVSNFHTHGIFQHTYICIHACICIMTYMCTGCIEYATNQYMYILHTHSDIAAYMDTCHHTHIWIHVQIRYTCANVYACQNICIRICI